MKHIWVVFFLSLTAAADKVAYPPQKISADGIKAIQIGGVNGELKLQAKPAKFFTFSVKHTRGRRAEDWNLLVDRRGDVLHLEVASVAYGSAWRKHIRADEWPEFDIVWEGPSVPAVISWRDGRLDVSNWRHRLETSLIKGAIFIRGGSGAFKLQTGKADVQVTRVDGQIEIRGEKGQVELTHSSGRAHLALLEGSLKVDTFKGDLVVESSRADLYSKGGDGFWNLNTNRAKSDLQDFRGRLKGKGTSGDWKVSTLGKAEIEIVSDSGGVLVTPARVGELKAFLTSATGAIEGPSWLRFSMREKVQVAEGRIVEKDLKQKAEIFVRTQSGPIKLTK